MSYSDESKVAPGSVTSGEFSWDEADVDLHEELGSAFSDLFANGSFWGDSTRPGVFEYDYKAIDYRDMLESDGKAASLERALTAPIMSADWKLEKPEDDQGQTDFVEQFLRASHHGGGMQTNFQTILGQATSARTYRKAFFEKTYKPGTGIFEGQVVYRDIAFRPVDTCKIWVDELTGRFKGFRQQAIRKDSTTYTMDQKNTIDFGPPNCWVHVNGVHRDPIGGWSDMKVALWCYKTKKRIMMMWSFYLMQQAEPKTIVGTDNAVDDAKKMARTMKGGSIVGMPNATSDQIFTLESSGTGATMFKDFMAYLDAQMLASCLAGFLDLTSPSQTGGSYALSADQSSFFKKSEQRFVMELEESITANVIADLVLMNFGPEASVPRFSFEPFESTGVEETAALLTPLMAEAPWKFKEELFMKMAQTLGMPVEEMRTALVEAGKVSEEKAAMGLEQQRQMTEGGAMENAVAALNGGQKPPGAGGSPKPPGGKGPGMAGPPKPGKF